MQQEERLQESAAALAAVEEQHEQSEAVRKELEEQLKYAHQHLAKKVRRTTELEDSLQNMQSQLDEAQTCLQEISAERDALHRALEQCKLREQSYEQKLKSAEESAEAVASEAEEKYYKMYEALKKTEAKHEELKLIEDKYHQLQEVWANINGCFSLSGKQEEAPPSKKPYQNLFDLKTPGQTNPSHE